jgi:hypothetical protein
MKKNHLGIIFFLSILFIFLSIATNSKAETCTPWGAGSGSSFQCTGGTCTYPFCSSDSEYCNYDSIKCTCAGTNDSCGGYDYGRDACEKCTSSCNADGLTYSTYCGYYEGETTLHCILSGTAACDNTCCKSKKGSSYSCQDGECKNIASCSDSDGGQKFNTAGTCTQIDGTGTKTLTDSCSGNTLTEYYCKNNKCTIYNDAFGQPHVCESGSTCTNGVNGGYCKLNTASCTDNDDGRDYEDPSTCVDADGTHKDSCSSNTLTEYYCSGNSCAQDNHSCGSGYTCTTNTSEISYCKADEAITTCGQQCGGLCTGGENCPATRKCCCDQSGTVCSCQLKTECGAQTCSQLSGTWCAADKACPSASILPAGDTKSGYICCQQGTCTGGGGTPGGFTFELKNPLKFDSFEELIDNLINFIFVIGVVLAPLFYLLAGINIVTAAGNPQKVTTAKNIALYTTIGLFVILFAKGLISVLKSVIGVQ